MTSSHKQPPNQHIDCPSLQDAPLEEFFTKFSQVQLEFPHTTLQFEYYYESPSKITLIETSNTLTFNTLRGFSSLSQLSHILKRRLTLEPPYKITSKNITFILFNLPQNSSHQQQNSYLKSYTLHFKLLTIKLLQTHKLKQSTYYLLSDNLYILSSHSTKT